MPLFQSPFVGLSGLGIHIPSVSYIVKFLELLMAFQKEKRPRYLAGSQFVTSAFWPEDDIDKSQEVIP
jgi:hypothetical protein